MALERKYILPILVAVVVPVLVMVSTILGLEEFRDMEDRREMRNAGRVINGVVRNVSTVEWIESKLEETKPEVVILGNSLSNTDVLPALLARRLGLPKHKVQRFSVPNSLGPHWYAILKNRVYANGYEPKIVIILSDMQSLLATRPRSEAAYLNLTVQLNDSEPLIDEKLQRGSYWWDRVRENRGRMRERSLKDLRNLSVNVGWFHELTLEERQRTNVALEQVFDDRNTDMALHNNVIPIFNTKVRELFAYDPADLPLPKDSFIPDITRMVAKHDGKVVYLRPPLSPLLPDYAGDVVLPGVDGKVRRMVDKNGGLYLDMRGFAMNAGHYYNLDHMNQEGAKRFTEAVSQALLSIDAIGSKKRREPAEAELFTAVALVDGALQHVKPPARFYGDVPSIGPRAWEQGRFGRTFYSLPALAPISDRRTQELTPFAARCSPLRVLEAGEPLPHVGVSCDEVFKHGKGRVCHVDDRLFFSATDETSPVHNDRDYGLAFDPERSCEGALWMYPDDTVVLSWPDAALVDFDRPVRQLRFEAVEMLDRSAQGTRLQFEVTVKLRIGGEVVLEDTLSLDRVRNGPKSWRLPEGLSIGKKEVELLVENDTDSFLLLTSAVLSERNDGAIAP